MKIFISALSASVLLFFAANLASCTARGLGNQASALEMLVEASRNVRADRLVVLRDGVLMVDWPSGRYTEPYGIMSITKSVSALAVGTLFDSERIKLTDPLETFFPELRGDLKGRITVEQVLHQTSGLSHKPLEQDADDYVQAALALPIADPPGTQWNYNNVAVNLLSGIVERATGNTLEVYARDNLFAPLDIKEWCWEKDKAGHSWVAAFLKLRARDLSKIGQLIIDKGVWNGKRVVSSAWVDALAKPSTASPHYGLLWWLGLEEKWLRQFTHQEEAKHLFWSNGASNQLLLVAPKRKVVLVLLTESERRPEEQVKLDASDLDPVLQAFLQYSALQ